MAYVCAFERIHFEGWASLLSAVHEDRTHFKTTLIAIHMLPAMHIIFDIHTYM